MLVGKCNRRCLFQEESLFHYSWKTKALFHYSTAKWPLFHYSASRNLCYSYCVIPLHPPIRLKNIYIPFCYGTCTTHVGKRFQLFSPGQRDRKPLQVWKCQFACTRWQCLARRSASRYKLNTVCKNVTSIRHWRPNKVKQHCEEHVPTCDHFCWVFKRQKKKRQPKFAQISAWSKWRQVITSPSKYMPVLTKWSCTSLRLFYLG